MGPQHRLLGALTGAGWATLHHQPLTVVAITAAVSTATAAGPLSPDMDQSEWWRTIPGRGGHRRFTHWWGIPVAGWLLLPHVPALYAATWAALVLGWGSHLLGDLLFGRIPLLPDGSWKVGLRFHTGGRVEKILVRALLITGLLWLMIVNPTLTLLGAPA